MLRQIFEAFFFVQVVAETVAEETTKQFHAASEKWQGFCANGKSHENNGNDRVTEVAEAASRDYQKVTDSIKELFSSLSLLAQEYAKAIMPGVCESVSAVQEKAKEKAAAFKAGH